MSGGKGGRAAISSTPSQSLPYTFTQESRNCLMVSMWQQKHLISTSTHKLYPCVVYVQSIALPTRNLIWFGSLLTCADRMLERRVLNTCYSRLRIDSKHLVGHRHLQLFYIFVMLLLKDLTVHTWGRSVRKWLYMIRKWYVPLLGQC